MLKDTRRASKEFCLIILDKQMARTMDGAERPPAQCCWCQLTKLTTTSRMMRFDTFRALCAAPGAATAQQCCAVPCTASLGPGRLNAGLKPTCQPAVGLVLGPSRTVPGPSGSWTYRLLARRGTGRDGGLVVGPWRRRGQGRESGTPAWRPASWFWTPARV